MMYTESHLFARVFIQSPDAHVNLIKVVKTLYFPTEPPKSTLIPASYMYCKSSIYTRIWDGSYSTLGLNRGTWSL